jgi:stage II sporulation protein D
MRACPQCKETVVASPLTLKLMRDGIHVSPETTPRKLVELRGAFRVRLENPQQPEAGQTETAAGRWSISATPAGMRVLLTTSIERYVMAALNGEAAPDEPMESLKAMAVTARTFALVNPHRHAAEGFDLCDSTHCQALRFGATRPEIEQAVRATAGETLWYGARRAATYATQNCGGQTEDAGSVWPGLHAAYLHSHTDPYCLRRSAAKWHADIDVVQLTNILREQHWKLPAHIDAVQVVKRTPTGRAQLLAIIGEDKKIPVSASSLRFALDRALGWNQLRSDWYDVSLNHGTIRFDGKGYGHGVGLCQAGAFEMASEGRGYREILSFYFAGTQVRITSADMGWSKVAGAGWTLVTTGASHDIVPMANAAWEKAQSLFPPRTPVHPVVHLMPSTELFRQTTEEPGWMLASTRGSDVFLQPPSLLKAHGSESATLLHEFLHVLVEQEAIPQTPLWLREGLVEALADGPPRNRAASAPRMSATVLEAALAHPADAAESQHAHLVSVQSVQRFIDQYGFAAVRGWLHAGVPPMALAQVH